jgi:spore maturation protein CgeB
MVARVIGRSRASGPCKVVIADDSGLIYSDDYRLSWPKAFAGIGCSVEVVDINRLRKNLSFANSAYRTVSARGAPKMIAQDVLRKQPDLVWCHHGRAASADEFTAYLHRYGVKTAVYLCDEPYESGETARYSPKFDFVFTMDPCTIKTHMDARVNKAGVFYLPPAADPEHFKLVEYDGRRTTPAFFLGNASLPPRDAWLKMVEKVVEGCDIRFWPQNGKPVAKGASRWIPYEKHASLYASCFVGLNVHRDPGITGECWMKRVVHRPKTMAVPHGMHLASRSPGHEGTGFWNEADLPAAHVNPRFFEMAACGTLVVSDSHREELARMFPFAPRAGTPERFVELVLYYLEHLDEAEEIGRACSELISKQHTWRHRAAEIIERVGLTALLDPSPASYLGEPQGWMTPQDFTLLGVRSCLEATGRSDSWSPRFGRSLISGSGNPSTATSIDSVGPLLL